ncbi:PDZ domain-containing protein [Acetobacteraceae bacterium]|nr:PDZ domain-containing protein [Acetobacteraceae bacterium]
MVHSRRFSPFLIFTLAGLVGGALAGTLVSATFFFAMARYRHTGQGGFTYVHRIMPTPVSEPLVSTVQSSAGQVSNKPYYPRIGEPSLSLARPFSFAPLVHKVIPAVVNISVISPPDELPSEEQNVEEEGENLEENAVSASELSSTHPAKNTSDDDSGMGSGFIIDSSGVIVTNAHVIGDGHHVVVALADGHVLPGKLLGSDPLTDIAVLKIESTFPLPSVKWGNSALVDIGDWVLAAGNPFGFGSSVTAGIISAIGRDLGLGALDNYIQIDAPINPGNSGGPAFNIRGEVIAVNAAIATPGEGSVGIGFGVPSELVQPVVKQILKTGHVDHGWIGVTIEDSTTPLRIIKVDYNGPAWKAGLRAGDQLLQLDGVSVQSSRALFRSIGVSEPGSVFAFTIRRDGEQKRIPVRLGGASPEDIVAQSLAVNNMAVGDGNTAPTTMYSG